MTKTLQQIKDEVACEDNFHNWDDLFACCAMYDYGRLEWAIDEVAIRYVQEQNKELVDMLSILNKTFKSACGLHPITLEVDELIKSETEG